MTTLYIELKQAVTEHHCDPITLPAAIHDLSRRFGEIVFSEHISRLIGLMLDVQELSDYPGLVWTLDEDIDFSEPNYVPADRSNLVSPLFEILVSCIEFRSSFKDTPPEALVVDALAAFIDELENMIERHMFNHDDINHREVYTQIITQLLVEKDVQLPYLTQASINLAFVWQVMSEYFNTQGLIQTAGQLILPVILKATNQPIYHVIKYVTYQDREHAYTDAHDFIEFTQYNGRSMTEVISESLVVSEKHHYDSCKTVRAIGALSSALLTLNHLAEY